MAGKKKNGTRKTEVYAPQDVAIPRKLGGGTLKERVVRELPSKKVTRYALAYINSNIFSGDNGRVLGYDNSHNYSHKHLMGVITDDPFKDYEDLYKRFQEEWQSIAIEYVNGGKSND